MEKIPPEVKLWDRFCLLPTFMSSRVRKAYMKEFGLLRTHQFEFRLNGRWSMSSEEIAFLAQQLGCSVPEMLNPGYDLRPPVEIFHPKVTSGDGI